MLTVVLGVATAVLAVVALHRLSGRLGGVPGVVLLAVWPWVVPAAVVVPALALLTGHAVLGVVTTVLVLAQLAVLGPRAVRSRAPSPSGTSVRLMTANLYLGLADAEAVVALVREHGVDVLSVQELTPELVERLELAGVGALLSHRVVEPRGHGEGSGIWSRWPLTTLEAVQGARCAQPRARVHVGGGPVLDVTAVHLTAPVDTRLVGPWLREAAVLEAAVLASVRAGGPPSVLAGDFNATLDHPPLRRLLRAGCTDAAASTGAGLRTTWRQDGVAPPLVIDHVLLHGSVTARAVRVEHVPGSDHRAVVVDLVVADHATGG